MYKKPHHSNMLGNKRLHYWKLDPLNPLDTSERTTSVMIMQEMLVEIGQDFLLFSYHRPSHLTLG